MSESRQHLSYKFQRLRETIREAITTGEFSEKLPGERELARKFGVNAKTISKALTDLGTEGLLIRHVGRGTFVAGQDRANRGASATAQFVMLAPSDMDPSLLGSMFDMARSRMESAGHHLALKRVVLDGNGEIPERCLSVSRLRDLAGLAVLSVAPNSALLADLHRRHVPFVLCNSANALIKSNAVVADYARGGFELTEHLLLLGHQRIRLVVDQEDTYACDQIRRGYQSAMARYQEPSLPTVPVSPSHAASVFEKAPSASALVCLGGDLAVTLKNYLRRENINIPRQLSLAVMARPGHRVAVQESLTSYDVPAEKIVENSVQLLLDCVPGSQPREMIVPGSFNFRHSTAVCGATPK